MASQLVIQESSENGVGDGQGEDGVSGEASGETLMKRPEQVLGEGNMSLQGSALEEKKPAAEGLKTVAAKGVGERK